MSSNSDPNPRTLTHPAGRDAQALWMILRASAAERRHGTDRGQDARKSRRTYRFSKDWQVYEAMTSVTADRDNFCWPVRTLRVKGEADPYDRSSPRPSGTGVWGFCCACLPIPHLDSRSSIGC
jgi:hypothetical protein